MPFTTFVHKIDRAFALISQSRKQELNVISGGGIVIGTGQDTLLQPFELKRAL